MISEARGVLKLNSDPAFRVALNHLDKFSHVWILYIFHQHTEKGWRSTIRPPRLDAPRRVGVFASRSPHRPNPIGMSAVKLDRIDLDAKDGIEIHLSGLDILDGTPVLDIKPYLPFADSISDASGGWASSEIKKYDVSFSVESIKSIQIKSEEFDRDLKSLITQMLEFDPRPTSQRRAMPIEDSRTEGMIFGFRIFNFDVQWQIKNGAIYVLNLVY